MKISYKHIASCLHPRPKIKELSEKLFQLGHEHEVIDEIFDIELTPNRGDCLSLDGLLRDNLNEIRSSPLYPRVKRWIIPIFSNSEIITLCNL